MDKTNEGKKKRESEALQIFHWVAVCLQGVGDCGLVLKLDLKRKRRVWVRMPMGKICQRG